MTANILVRAHCRYSKTKYEKYPNDHHHGGGGVVVWCVEEVVVVPLVVAGDARRVHDEQYYQSCCRYPTITSDILNILHLNIEHKTPHF